MNIYFPKSLKSDKKGIEFISYVWGKCKKIYSYKIFWNLRFTSNIETNLLSVLGIIIDKLMKKGNKIFIELRDNKGILRTISSNIIEELFMKYSEFKFKALQYKYINFSIVNNEIDKYLNEDLKELRLKEFEKVKIILSELIANIKMHASSKQGSISAFIDIKKDELVVSVCNIGKTIKQNIEEKVNYNFDNDLDAILWALRKTNTTRNKDESGGLGLFYLRKYLYEINGRVCIVSGKGMAELNKWFYNEKNVNEIDISDSLIINSFFPGTLITISIDYDKNEGAYENYFVKEFDLFQIFNIKE